MTLFLISKYEYCKSTENTSSCINNSNCDTESCCMSFSWILTKIPRVQDKHWEGWDIGEIGMRCTKCYRL